MLIRALAVGVGTLAANAWVSGTADSRIDTLVSELPHCSDHSLIKQSDLYRQMLLLVYYALDTELDDLEAWVVDLHANVS